jgi:hypothetical protein
VAQIEKYLRKQGYKGKSSDMSREGEVQIVQLYPPANDPHQIDHVHAVSWKNLPDDLAPEFRNTWQIIIEESSPFYDPDEWPQGHTFAEFVVKFREITGADTNKTSSAGGRKLMSTKKKVREYVEAGDALEEKLRNLEEVMKDPRDVPSRSQKSAFKNALLKKAERPVKPEKPDVQYVEGLHNYKIQNRWVVVNGERVHFDFDMQNKGEKITDPAEQTLTANGWQRFNPRYSDAESQGICNTYIRKRVKDAPARKGESGAIRVEVLSGKWWYYKASYNAVPVANGTLEELAEFLTSGRGATGKPTPGKNTYTSPARKESTVQLSSPKDTSANGGVYYDTTVGKWDDGKIFRFTAFCDEEGGNEMNEEIDVDAKDEKHARQVLAAAIAQDYVEGLHVVRWNTLRWPKDYTGGLPLYD